MNVELVTISFSLLGAGILFLASEMLRLKRELTYTRRVLEEQEEIFRNEINTLRVKLDA